MTVNAFAAVSLDPMLVLVCIRQDSEMRRLFDELDFFAVSVLAADQEPVARWFANPRRPAGLKQFDAVAWRAGVATGSPLIDQALAWLECAVVQQIPAGDHTILLGRVLSFDCATGAEPLTFFGGSFGTVTAGRPDATAVST
jgi:flavin reductase (DIM6/NTAB) family NADH-FMN oxidoreductase RutF